MIRDFFSSFFRFGSASACVTHHMEPLLQSAIGSWTHASNRNPTTIGTNRSTVHCAPAKRERSEHIYELSEVIQPNYCPLLRSRASVDVCMCVYIQLVGRLIILCVLECIRINLSARADMVFVCRCVCWQLMKTFGRPICQAK